MCRIFLSSFILLSTWILPCQAKVVVVGAGFGGLTTAYRLAERGLEVEVYEARGRVGGRVWTVQQNGIPVEVGGQNILDGGAATNLLKLAADLGLATESSHLPKEFFYVESETQRSLRELLERARLNPETLWERLEHLANSAGSIEEVLKDLFSEQPELYAACTALMSSFIGGPVDLQSSLNVDSLYEMLMAELSPAFAWDEYVCHLGIEGGNDRLAREMAARLGDRVFLNEALVRLERNESGDYRLSFSSGGVVEADTIVLAIPCSVYDCIEVDPQVIPSERLDAICHSRYANCSKVLLPLTMPLPGRQLVHERWISYFPGREEQLVLYYVNEASLFGQEDLQRDFQEDLAIVSQALGESLSFPVPTLLEGGEESVEGPIAYNWSADPWSRGAYTFEEAGKEDWFQKLIEVNGERFRFPFAPLNDSLFFVGEHNSIFLEYAGTMESAVESGERTARYILDRGAGTGPGL